MTMLIQLLKNVYSLMVIITMQIQSTMSLVILIKN